MYYKFPTALVNLPRLAKNFAGGGASATDRLDGEHGWTDHVEPPVSASNPVTLRGTSARPHSSTLISTVQYSHVSTEIRVNNKSPDKTACTLSTRRHGMTAAASHWQWHVIRRHCQRQHL